MFRPETEDSLPREAPKPTENNAAILESRPTVPELSLLFGQDDCQSVKSKTSSEENAIKEQKPKSYAEWKKQVLPRVSYPPKVCFADDKNKDCPTARSSIYPFRHIPSTGSNINTYPTNVQKNPVPGMSNNLQYKRDAEEANRVNAMYIPPNQEFMYVPVQSTTLQTQQGRSCEPTFKPISNDMLANPSTCTLYPSGYGKPSNKFIGREEVLSICAGTQTDISDVIPNSIQNTVTKDDFLRLVSLVETIQNDQKRLLQFCETFLQKDNQVTKTSIRDVGVQCEITPNTMNGFRRPLNLKPDCILEESPQEALSSRESQSNQHEQMPLPANNYYKRVADLANFQSPRSSKPVAQSTTYRPNTPQFDKQKDQQIKNLEANVLESLPKPTTEKSLVMNELALKYLPNDKLSELLQEIELSSPNQKTFQPKLMIQKPLVPLKEIDNFVKSPNDMSNASYKYLKKYRLLPEDNQRGYQGEKSENKPASPFVIQHSPYNSPAPRPDSPLTLRRSKSPRRVCETESASSPINVIDLEHIKSQPKFF